MNKGRLIMGLFLILGMALLPSCAPQAAPAPQAPAPVAAPLPRAPAPAAIVPAPAQPVWEIEWEKALAAAKQEGGLLVYTSAGAAAKTPLYKGFLERFGIKMESVTGRPTELIPKILAERNAGLYFGDVSMLVPSSSLPLLKPKGVLEKLDPWLVLPEVTDPKMWMGGRIRWSDPDHTVLPALAYVSGPLIINKELVKPGEVTGYKDLLDPKWKGRIVLDDPASDGPGGTQWVVIGSGLMGWDYLQEFASKQEPLISRDWRQQAEWMARGKAAIGVGLQAGMVFEFQQAGAPLSTFVPKEGAYASSSSGVASVFTRAPHPNVAKVFVNWFLSKEGQNAAVRGYGLPSARVDVSYEGVQIDPARILQPGVNYVFIDEETFILNSPAYRQKVREIFAAVKR